MSARTIRQIESEQRAAYDAGNTTRARLLFLERVQRAADAVNADPILRERLESARAAWARKVAAVTR